MLALTVDWLCAILLPQAPNSLHNTSWLYIACGATAVTCPVLLPSVHPALHVSGPQAPNSLDKTSWLYIAYGATAVSCLLFLLTCLMASRVKIAVACLKVRCFRVVSSLLHQRFVDVWSVFGRRLAGNAAACCEEALQ